MQYLSMCGRAVSIDRAGVSVSALTILALDGIAVTVNPDNPVNAPELETIAGIYTGEITNWKDIGGNDLKMVLIGREAGSGKRDGFKSIKGTEDDCKYRQELTSLQVFTVRRLRLSWECRLVL